MPKLIAAIAAGLMIFGAAGASVAVASASHAPAAHQLKADGSASPDVYMHT
jgi:hypothetical protein